MSIMLNRLSELMLKFHRGTLSPEERDELDQWQAVTPRNRQLFRELTEENLLRPQLEEMELFAETPVREKVEARMPGVFGIRTGQETPAISLRRRWPRIAAAAGILALAGIGAWWFQQTRQRPAIVIQAKADIPAPTGSRTTLTLGNGRQIVLDSVGAGTLTREGGATVAKQGSAGLSYKAVPDKAIAGNNTPMIVLYNTLTTARGGQTQVKLADGSRVWLNTASSLKFPTVFTGANRGVDLTGEAYFEIAPHPNQPFIVRVNGSRVEVLGTHFNIMAYTDEEDQQTTLLEGAVKVSKASASRILQPGQQAVLDNRKSTLSINKDVDAEEVLAWKNGLFEFNGLDIQGVLRQVSRWYDVNVVFAGLPPSGHFSGVVSRTSNVSDVLRIFEQANIHYTISGNQITILP
jgi:transmembrane sensor